MLPRVVTSRAPAAAPVLKLHLMCIYSFGQAGNRAAVARLIRPSATSRSTAAGSRSDGAPYPPAPGVMISTVPPARSIPLPLTNGSTRSPTGTRHIRRDGRLREPRVVSTSASRRAATGIPRHGRPAATPCRRESDRRRPSRQPARNATPSADTRLRAARPAGSRCWSYGHGRHPTRLCRTRTGAAANRFEIDPEVPVLGIDAGEARRRARAVAGSDASLRRRLR